MRSDVKPITVDWVRDQAALMDCSRYAAVPRPFLGEMRSQAEQFNEDLKALKVPTADAKKIDAIEKIFLNELKKDLLLYAAHFETEFKRINERLTQCPLNDENKSDLNTYLAHCEKYKERYKRIETDSNQLIAMSSAASHAKDLVFETFCGSIKNRLDTAKESLIDPAKAISPLPPASWVEKAYKETKSDLNYCKNGAEKQNLLQKKLDVYLTDAAASKGESSAITKLNALQAKLEYQEALYTARKDKNEHHGISFFKAGYSAKDKLTETKNMIGIVDKLRKGEDVTEDMSKLGKAATSDRNSTLTKLYKELETAVAARVTPSTPSP